MDEENYKLLLQQIEERDKRINELEHKVDDVIAMNKALLSRDNGDDNSTADEGKNLKQRLEEGIYGRR